MTITVLLAPDGSRVWAALGKHSLWSAADLMEAVSRGEALPAQATYIANHGVTFEAFVWDNEIRELAPGYTLEHHDLAELLTRPKSRASIDVHIRGLPGLEAYVDKQIAEVVQPLIREREALARSLAAIPALFQKSAGEIYGHAYAAGHEDERAAQRLEGDWSQS